jgi:hypothetical protein
VEEPIEGRSRLAAALVGVGIGFASFIVIAILSSISPTQWLVPIGIIGTAVYFRQKANTGLWGFNVRRTSNIGFWVGGFALFFALVGSAPQSSTDDISPASSSNVADSQQPDNGLAAAEARRIAAEQAKKREAENKERMRNEPEKFVELENIDWSMDFSIMELSVTIKNNAEIALKDFVIDCEHSAASGTVIDSNRREIFEVVEAGKSKRITKFNMGFINSQAVSTACVVTRAKVV